MGNLENKMIALCMADASEANMVKWMIKIHQAAKKVGCKLVIFSTASTLSTVLQTEATYKGDCSIYDDINFEKFDGVICFGEAIGNGEIVDKIVAEANRVNIPVVSFDYHIEGASTIKMDYITAFEVLVRHVVEHHKVKRVNFVSGVPNNDFSKEREDIYKKVLQENGIEFDENRFGYGCFWEGPTREVVNKFLEYDIPEAIICANDSMAIETCKILESKGIKVPEQVIVTGFDGIPQAKWCDPDIATCEMDYDLVSDTMFNIISDKLEGKKTEAEISVPYQFVLGGSCGCTTENTKLNPETMFEMYENNKFYAQYQANLYEMQTFTAQKESVMQLATVIHSYMVSDGFVVVRTDIPEFGYVSKQNDDTLAANSQMRVLVRKKDIEIEIGTVFNKKNIVPNLESVVSVDRPLILLPVHSGGNSFGYVAYSIEDTQLFFSKIVAFNYAIGNALEIFKSQKSLRVANRKLEEANDKLEDLYVRDALTKVYNRRGFYTAIPKLIKECIKNDWDLFVASIDMDDLKVINDTYGHAEGDESLKTFANAMSVNVHKYEICSRFGGDEFVVAGISKSGEESGNRYIKSVMNYLQNYNRDSGKPYQIRASYGLFVKKPDDTTSIDEYILKADRIMYENKKENKREFRTKVRGVPGTLLNNDN